MVALTFFSLELITQAASNSVVVFFFCNVIIVTILVASRPPPPSTTGIRHVSVSGNPYVTIYQQEETVIGGHTHALPPSDENRASEPKFAAFVKSTHQVEEEEEDEDEEEDEKEVVEVEEEGEEEDGDDYVEEEEEDDELRRRVEEFIEKTNKEWRAELLRTSQSRVIAR